MAKAELYATKALGVARRETELTQAEMAEILSIKLGRNISLELYRKWETGKRATGTNEALAIRREVNERRLNKIALKEMFGKGEYNFEQ